MSLNNVWRGGEFGVVLGGGMEALFTLTLCVKFAVTVCTVIYRFVRHRFRSVRLLCTVLVNYLTCLPQFVTSEGGG